MKKLLILLLFSPLGFAAEEVERWSCQGTAAGGLFWAEDKATVLWWARAVPAKRLKIVREEISVNKRGIMSSRCCYLFWILP
ncbi:hypothetical protein N8303_03090 [Gammaproteobacteria bacterium]|nr:hypothetical protein [Gammaproteobacteria bacterium]